MRRFLACLSHLRVSDSLSLKLVRLLLHSLSANALQFWIRVFDAEQKLVFDLIELLGVVEVFLETLFFDQAQLGTLVLDVEGLEQVLAHHFCDILIAHEVPQKEVVGHCGYSRSPENIPKMKSLSKMGNLCL